MSKLFASRGESIGASASVLPMIYSVLISFSVDWFDLLESSPVVDSFFFYLFLSSSQLVPRIKALSVPQQQMAFISTTFPTAVNLFLEVGKRGIFSLL